MHQNSEGMFCFGYGYVAKALSESLKLLGYAVTGTSRAATEASSLVVFKENHPVPRDILFQHTHFLISIAPGESGDLVFQQHEADLKEHPDLRWIGYLSSTSVYGDWQGAWVDETFPCRAEDKIELARLNAEQAWLSLYERLQLPVHIFRLSGIYGPGRNMMDRILSGQAIRIEKPGQFFSRIHVEDIVQVLLASIRQPHPGQIYNLSDDYPCSSREITEYVCDQLGIPYPPLQNFEDADLSPMAKHFYKNNRRVSNRKIKEELGVQLRYPTYREGLRGILDEAKTKV